MNSAMTNKRELHRLPRRPDHNWQLRVDGDMLITKNIMNISPTGLAFKAPLSSKLRAGQVIHVTVSLTEDENFDCDGEIVWSSESLEVSGSMKQLGVRLLNLPARIDAAIMRELNFNALKLRRQALDTDLIPQFKLERNFQKVSFYSFALKICGMALVAATSAALIAAIYIHQQTHPEDTFEYKFNHAMIDRAIKGK